MPEEHSATNHRLAPRMAALAFCSQNLTMGAAYGPFGVLLLAVEARYGVSREGSSLALPLMSASLAICAPLVGAVSERVSARLLMMFGGVLGAAGYAILALSNQHLAYLFVYVFCFGPAICLSGVIVPSALVTRWFSVKRGRALGIVHMPLLQGPLALGAAFLLHSYGLSATYAALSALGAINFLIAFFVVDAPPGVNAAKKRAAGAPSSPAPFGVLFSDQRLWLLTFAFGANVAAQIMVGAHLIPMVRGWGVAPSLAASLVLATSLAGVIGTPVLGGIMDRLGARATIALLCVDCAILWGLLLFQPPFAVLVMIAFGLGFHGGATMAIFAGAISEYFGQATFSRAFGLSKMFTLPVSLLAVPAAAMIYVRTGSYVPAIAAQAIFLLFGATAIAFTGLSVPSAQSGAKYEHAD